MEEVTPKERGFANTISATVNIDIFALYIFSGYWHLSSIRENMYIVEITLIMPQRDKYVKNANINLRKIAYF